MFEISIITIIFTICIIMIYRKFFKIEYETGEWLTIDKDIKIDYNINWDVSEKSVVKVLNFKRWRKYFFGGDLFNTFSDKEGLLLKFKDDCILDVCDDKMNNIYHIFNPTNIIFSNNSKNHYKLNSKKRYVFFLRTDIEKNENNISKKYYDIAKFNFKVSRENNQICYIDEDELFTDFFKESEKIRNAMLKRGYNLYNVARSEEYLSFPNNSISNKLEVESELGDVLILVTTNKTLTSDMKNHNIEINSQNNNFVWEPESQSNIAHLLLDNCDQDDTFYFYERTTNIKNSSNILPFQVLVFRK